MLSITISEATAHIIAVTGLLTILWAISCKLASRLSKIRTKEIIEATSRSNQIFIKKLMLEVCANQSPDSFHTLEICFDGGHRLAVPMFRHRAIMVSENMHMTVISHGPQHTIMTLICNGFGSLKNHWHPDTCETIQVIEGVMTDMKTGKMYRAGESWAIPIGEPHSATFHDFVGFVTHRPPLKSAKDRPVDLADIEKIFPS